MAGQGKIGVANGIMGLYDARGEVTFNGEKINLNSPAEPLSKGLFLYQRIEKGLDFF